MDLDELFANASEDVLAENRELIEQLKRRPRRAISKRTEHEEQDAVFQWAVAMSYMMPELELLFAIPNGQYRPGQRIEPGLRRGVPDICLPVARGKYHALYIELKVGRNKPTEDQEWWARELQQQGNKVAVCYGAQAAQDEILRYLGEES